MGVRSVRPQRHNYGGREEGAAGGEAEADMVLKKNNYP